MPLAHGRGTVAGTLQQQRDSVVLPRVDQRRAEPIQDPAGERRPPRIAPGQQAVTRRRADRRRAVGIGEAHALARQPVDVGRGNLGRGLVRLRVAPAHVIRQHNNDVRQLCTGDCRERSKKQQDRLPPAHGKQSSNPPSGVCCPLSGQLDQELLRRGCSADAGVPTRSLDRTARSSMRAVHAGLNFPSIEGSPPSRIARPETP